MECLCTVNVEINGYTPLFIHELCIINSTHYAIHRRNLLKEKEFSLCLALIN